MVGDFSSFAPCVAKPRQNFEFVARQAETGAAAVRVAETG